MSDRTQQPQTQPWPTTVLTRPPPPRVHHRTTTGRVHGVLTRVSQNRLPSLLPSSTKQYRFDVQLPGGTSKHIMTALGNGHTYQIHAMNTPDGTMGPCIGTLTRIQMNMHSITYALKDVDDRPITVIVYQVSSPLQVLRDPPARRAQVGILPPTLSAEQAPASSSITDLYQAFAKSCHESIVQHHNLSQVGASVAMVLQSKTPYAQCGGRVALNFQGRGRYPSPKNMQLTDAADSVEAAAPKIYLQMAKWEDQTYYLDFSAPLTFLYAFAFGLAQVDL